MFKPLIEGDLLTGQVTNHSVEIPIRQARQALTGKSEKDVRFLWKKVDVILAGWVAANRRTPPKPSDYGLGDVDTPKNCLRRLPNLDDADLITKLLFQEYPPVGEVIGGEIAS